MSEHNHNQYRRGCRCSACRASWRAYTADLVRWRRLRGLCLRCTQRAEGFVLCPRHRQQLAAAKRAQRAEGRLRLSAHGQTMIWSIYSLELERSVKQGNRGERNSDFHATKSSVGVPETETETQP